jgi:hypothetical protein
MRRAAWIRRQEGTRKLAPHFCLSWDWMPVKPSYLDQLERSLVCQVGSMSCCIRIITPTRLWELRAGG